MSQPSLESLLAEICAEPQNLAAPLDLYLRFLDTGVLDMVAGISEAEIEAYLRQRPELVRQWVGLSEDQRCSPAWFIQEKRPGEWIVGIYPKQPSEPTRRFSDGYAATAFFVKRHMGRLLELARERR